MAKAFFFVNDLKVKTSGEYLIVQAQNKCQHGTVFDEVILTLPKEMGGNFKSSEDPPLPLRTFEILNTSPRLGVERTAHLNFNVSLLS